MNNCAAQAFHIIMLRRHTGQASGARRKAEGYSPLPHFLKIRYDDTMEIGEARKKFIDYWGDMATKWGVPPAMAQIHALLLASPEALCASQICDELGLSVGSVSTNLRELEQHWGLVYRQPQSGRNKDLYTAEKDMWTVVRQIVKNRKERELDPMFKILDELCELEPKCPHSHELCNTIQDIRKFTHKTNDMLNLFLRNDSNWIMRALMR